MYQPPFISFRHSFMILSPRQGFSVFAQGQARCGFERPAEQRIVRIATSLRHSSNRDRWIGQQLFRRLKPHGKNLFADRLADEVPESRNLYSVWRRLPPIRSMTSRGETPSASFSVTASCSLPIILSPPFFTIAPSCHYLPFGAADIIP